MDLQLTGKTAVVTGSTAGVIFMSSESAVQIPAEMIHYGVTKIAQVGLARPLSSTTNGAALRADGGVVRAAL